jgi:hypothetical protein
MNMLELETLVYQVLKKLDNGVNIGWGTFLKTANRVFKYVASKTLPYKGWAYQKYSSNMASGDVIPLDYIDKVRCVIHSADGNYREARYSHPREYFITTNADTRNSFVQSTAISPIYTLFGDLDTSVTPNQQRIKLFFSAEAGADYATLTYYGEPPDMVNKTDLVPIPNEYENLAILEIAARILLLIGTPNDMKQIYDVINQESYVIVQRLSQLKISEKKALERNTPQSFYTQEELNWKMNGWQDLYRGS